MSSLSAIFLPPPADKLNKPVEAVEESGAVPLVERSRAARYRPHVAELGHQLPTCQGIADGVLAKRLSARVQHPAALFHATGRQRNVRRHHNVVLGDMLRNPVIGRIEPAVHKDQFQPRLLRHAHQRVRHHRNLQAVTLRHHIARLTVSGIILEDHVRDEALEDIVGDLIDREEEMTEDVEDVTSGWLDSLDKGAGWDAMDGPISNMSAKGVTGR